MNSLPNGEILEWSKFKVFAEDKTNVNEMISLSDRVENIVGKEDCRLPAFSLYTAMLSKYLLFIVVKSWDCVVKS